MTENLEEWERQLKAKKTVNVDELPLPEMELKELGGKSKL